MKHAFLESAMRRNHLPHALLFLGPEGSGRREAVKELAAALFCEDKKAAAACGSCTACLQIQKDSHPDLVWSGPEGESQTIKVEEIRRLIALSNLKPFRAPAKIFVIDKAERMNEVSQNALLKTLEEPLGRTHFILFSSDPQGLLPTVRSRMQTLHFVAKETPAVSNPEMDVLKKEALQTALALLNGRPETVLPDFSKLDRPAAAEILDFLICSFRESLVWSVGARELADSPAGGTSLDERTLFDAIELAAETKERISGMVNAKLAFAFLWDSLAEQGAGKSL